MRPGLAYVRSATSSCDVVLSKLILRSTADCPPPASLASFSPERLSLEKTLHTVPYHHRSRLRTMSGGSGDDFAATFFFIVACIALIAKLCRLLGSAATQQPGPYRTVSPPTHNAAQARPSESLADVAETTETAVLV